ncbi:MAG: penicillin-binding protein 2 [Candidatus Wildermuthbacteria bacterium RIFCSPLOWO2_01_FULL_47_18]|uniref:Penicillin-binding protein 2 n=1 Tax=Candidatus Wildermuthbacteria bacterium RIFCSPLOWO2_01_FULL_47_18 TaxID=1802460 RepID=A0A1G2RJX9_9BACT|nr:MAG: penicillin-binding protein 2 [Candidatus Wildermuthbacteria bacterium RIFCSPLOWO2_01_FULL_47_18]
MFDFLTSEKGSLRVERKNLELEPQEVIVDSFARKNLEEGFLQERKLEVPISKTALRVFFGAFLLMLLVFFSKTLSLQAFSGTDYRELARKNVARETFLTPDRGIILDQNLVSLVVNLPSFDFVCDKRDMPFSNLEKESILKHASQLLNQDFSALKKEFDENPNPLMLLKENLSHESLVLLNVREKDFPGCQIFENKKREYVKGDMFAHLLGYTAKINRSELGGLEGYSPVDQIGKDGVEKAYEKVLRGKPGKFVVQKDAQGRTIAESLEQTGESGQSVVLWLDSKLQETLVKALQNVFSQTGAKKAAAVALDPRTGGVLALVSLPSFDNNMFSEGLSFQDWEKLSNNPSKPLFNRAIAGLGYPTGSVIKPFVGMAALEENVIQDTTSLFAPYEICVDNQYTKEKECFRDWKFHGQSDIKRAIAESVNTFFYIIGGGHEQFRGLGATRILEYLRLFGWGSKTDIDLPGEGKGVLPEINKNWRLGDTYHLSIGQGPFAVTPLQVATATAAIANRGKLLQPQVVKSIQGGESFNSTLVRENFLDPENIEVIRQGMRQTVTRGSATGWLDDLPVKAAAKTGTAQTGKVTPDGKDYLYSWITAFAPFDNPEIVLVVVVEDVKEGNVAALPVAREAFQYYFSK